MTTEKHPTEEPGTDSPHVDAPSPEDPSPEPAGTEPVDEQPVPPQDPDDAAEAPVQYLYATPSFKRYFAVPEGAELGEGDFEVVSFRHGLRRVSADDIEPYEVPRAEARELFRRRVDTVVDEAGRAFERSGRVVRDAASRLPRPTPEQVDRALTPFAQALGVSTDQLRKDPDAVFTGLRERAVEAGRRFREALDPETRENVRRQWADLSRTARRETEKAAEELQRLPGAFRTFSERLRHRGHPPAEAEE